MFKWTEKNILLLYCFALFNIACLFAGHEISEAKHEDEVRSNQKILNNCNRQIRGGIYKRGTK